jgi:C4-dicarboxylate-binding protein DctP
MKFRENRSADIRTILEGAMKEATQYNNAMSNRDTVDAWKAVKASGKSEVYKLTPAEKEAWINAMSPVQDEMAGRVGKAILAAIRKEVLARKPAEHVFRGHSCVSSAMFRR